MDVNLERWLERIEDRMESMETEMRKIAASAAFDAGKQRAENEFLKRFWEQTLPLIEERIQRLENHSEKLATHDDVEGIKKFVWMGMGGIGVVTVVFQFVIPFVR